ncbi:MAG TPA: T9SS type A sorting domain-containing protein [Parafilimonas sp.]|nr:T9SS type A sorting domain-containing protein [Parafilimonas sp.]
MKHKNLLLGFILLFITNTNNAQSWLLTGNSGTSANSNFIGTLDSKAFAIRTNNEEKVRILPNGKVGIGTSEPITKLDVKGDLNIKKNAAYHIGGIPVLRTNSNHNLIIGGLAGGALESTAMYNTMCGEQAMGLNRTGNFNTAIGTFSLFFMNALVSDENTATGYYSLGAMEGGNHNAAFGAYALGGLTTGDFNVGVGVNALKTKNSSIGVYGGTAVGYNSLLINSFGDNNTAVGYNTLSSLYAGAGNTAIGALADVNDSFNVSNSTALGHEAIATAPNQVRLGNSVVTSIGGYATWGTIADLRITDSVQRNVPGLDFINKLVPVTFRLNLDSADKIIQRPVRYDKNGKVIQMTSQEIEGRIAKQKIIYTGFIAQDVEKVAKKLKYDFSGIDFSKNNKDLRFLRYAEFVVPLVKAVQELSAENDELKSRLDKLEKLIDEDKDGDGDDFKTTVFLSDAGIEQNTPNPFRGNTVIHYYLPKAAGNAVININNIKGKLIKSISLNAKGNGQLTLEANELSAGSYTYTLIVNGKIIDSKKMIIQ